MKLDISRKLLAVLFLLIIPFLYWGFYTAPGYTWEHMISMNLPVIHILGDFGYYCLMFLFYGLLIIPLTSAWFAYLVWPKRVS